MRVFTAVDISEPVRRGLSGLLEEFRKTDPDIKWIDPTNMHVTLYFFGETGGETLEKVRESVREAAGGVSVCTVSIEELGGFPSLVSPRILWAGVRDEEGALKRISCGIKDRVTARSLHVNRNDREYSPHLTLGRVKKRPRPGILESFLDRRGERFGSFEVTRVVLYSSTLTRNGPVYRSIGEYPLREG